MKFNSTMFPEHRWILAGIFLVFMCHLGAACPDTGKADDTTAAGEVLAKPLRVGVVGLVHTHVHWILGREDRGDIRIVGIVEPNRELALQYSRQHGFSMDLVYDNLADMVKEAKPEAVTAFNTIYDHLETVKYCAPLGIHVMVEKPLAVSLDHALQMAALARKHGIQLLTNYETSWYGSNYAAYDSVHTASAIGAIRKIVFHTGHPGPVEIGCNPEFLEWLTDPERNGGGALTDFGCYGANLATWLMQGEPPLAVSCVTQQIKPHLYPEVEDEATIVLIYPRAQVIIQASWNWPHNVKDMEIYGTDGIFFSKNNSEVMFRQDEKQELQHIVADPLKKGYDDPFALLHKVVHEGYRLPPFAPSSLENNLVVMRILEAAKRSAASGRMVKWSEL